MNQSMKTAQNVLAMMHGTLTVRKMVLHFWTDLNLGSQGASKLRLEGQTSTCMTLSLFARLEASKLRYERTPASISINSCRIRLPPLERKCSCDLTKDDRSRYY